MATYPFSPDERPVLPGSTVHATAYRRAPRVVVTPSGCLTAGVTVAGLAQPELWDDTGLIRAAQRLLHVKSVQ